MLISNCCRYRGAQKAAQAPTGASEGREGFSQTRYCARSRLCLKNARSPQPETGLVCSVGEGGPARGAVSVLAVEGCVGCKEIVGGVAPFLREYRDWRHLSRGRTLFYGLASRLLLKIESKKRRELKELPGRLCRIRSMSQHCLGSFVKPNEYALTTTTAKNGRSIHGGPKGGKQHAYGRRLLIFGV
jgi:hypothetical protein